MIGDDRVQAPGEAQFRQLVESFAQAVWETDANGVMVVDSPSWRAYTGQSLEESMGGGWLDAVHPEDRDYVTARWSEAVATGRSYDADFRLRHVSNDWRWTNVRAIPVRDASDKVEKWIGLNIDIDERKQAEQKLQSREEELARVQRIGEVGGLDIDVQNGLMGHRTPEYRRLHGLPPDQDQEAHRDWLARVHPDDREHAEKALFEALQGKTGYENEYRIVRAPDGATRWIQAKADILRDNDGKATRIVGAHIDVTDRKQAENTKKLLLDELRHRVRNTVGIMRSLARRTARHSDNMDDFCNHLEGRLSAVARTQAQIMRDPLSGVDLETLIAEEMHSLHAREGEQLSLKGPAVSLVPSAAEKIGLAIHELGTNAMKYGALASEAGTVTVHWTLSDDMLKLEWKEDMRSKVQPPLEYSGFGTELIEHILQYDLSAQTTLEFTERGLHCKIAIPGKFLRT